MPVKILLADKSITIQRVVEMLFSGRDYEVTSVSDGDEALSEAARVIPDVILADVDLPRLDGYAFSERLKQTPLLAQTPVILMMSRDDVYDSTKGRHAGIIDNIAKPFESQELIGKVKKALAAAPPKLAEVEKPAAGPQPSAPAAYFSDAALQAANPVQKAYTDIFDIIQEAPTESEFKKAAAPAIPEAETVYEVEPDVEEVMEPLGRKIVAALPVGNDKALDEMPAGLGLTDQTVETAPEAIPNGSFEAAMATPATEDVSMPPVSSHPAMPTETIAVSSTLSADELRKMAEDIITKMAKDVFAQMPPVQPPKISDEVVRSVIEEAAANMIKNVFEKKLPQALEEMLRCLVEENVLKFVNETLEKTAIPKPSTLPESELRKMAEATINKMALDVFKNLPPPPIPKISNETVRRGLESVLSQIAREMAKEVIEQVSWEVIPQLAEHLIKEEIERLKAET